MKAEFTYRPIEGFAPRPVVPATLRHPRTKQSVDVDLLLDTGADVTLIPSRSADAIGLTDRLPTGVSGFDGEVRPVTAAIVALGISDWLVRTPVLIDDVEEGVLGRNLLSLFKVTLDGPAGSFTIETPA